MGLLTVIPDGAVAVREGRIVAVGPTREIEAQITEAAEILEARGLSLIHI
jgi:predicted amidohydrolase YtcJ